MALKSAHLPLFVLANIIIACAFLFIQIHGESSLTYSRVHLVDRIHGNGFTNYVYRSNVPVQNGVFVYDTLLKYMADRANEAQVPFPDEPYLVDITLMNPIDEPAAEKAFWADSTNADKGEYVVWPMGLAGLYDARNYDEATQRTMSNTTVWEFDQIPTRLNEFFGMINSPGPISPTTGKPRSKLILFHCAAGADRTGQWAIAYRLAATNFHQFTENTLQEYFKLNVEECGRSPNDWSVKGTEWFCLYMRYNFNIHMGDCLKIADCKRFGSCTWPPAE